MLYSPKVQPYYTYLIDKNNDVINQWGPHDGQPIASAPYLLPDDKMIYPSKVPSSPYGFSSVAANGGRIRIYDS